MGTQAEAACFGVKGFEGKELQGLGLGPWGRGLAVVEQAFRVEVSGLVLNSS